MDEQRDKLNEAENERKAAARGFDAWGDSREQDPGPFGAQPGGEPGVIDIPQTGSLFEVLSETAAKEAAEAAAAEAAATAAEAEAAATAAAAAEAAAEAVAVADAVAAVEAAAGEAAEAEPVYEVRFDPPSSSRLVPPFDVEAETHELEEHEAPAPGETEPPAGWAADTGAAAAAGVEPTLTVSDEPGMSGGPEPALPAGDEPEQSAAARSTRDFDDEQEPPEIGGPEPSAIFEPEQSAAARSTRDFDDEQEPPAEWAADTIAAIAADAAPDEAPAEELTEAAAEEEYTHPFFELPPLERSRKIRKRSKGDRVADAEAAGVAGLTDTAEQAQGVELWKILLLVLLCMLLAIGSYFVGQVYGATLIPEEPALIVPPDEEALIEAPGEESKGPQILTLLLMGTDEREKGEQARADTIILVAINLDTRDVDMISIPRDTRTQIADSDSITKINHAHTYGGPELLVKTVENLLGVNVHYYVETNFKGFAKCVDILGGVDYDVERRMYFPEEGIDLFAGRQKLDGDKALQYVRWRGDPSADIGRVARQQKFVKAFLDQAISLGTVAKLPSLMGELRDNVKTDMTTPKMLNLAFRFTDIKSLSFSSATLPGEAKTIGGGAYWVMDEEAARELLLSIYAPPEPEAEAGEDADGNAGEDTDNDDAGEAGATADGADGEAA